MKNKPIISYEFAVLRYVHDTLTGEFINVGVSISAPSIHFADLKFKSTFGRIKKAFPNIDGPLLLKNLRSIEKKFEKNISSNLMLLEQDNLETLMLKVLPHDDSSLQWQVVGSGISYNIEKTFLSLFDKYVMRYEEKSICNKTDEDVWRYFKKNLQDRKILSHVQPHVISTTDDEIRFDHTLKNGSLHCLEPLSFDLTTSEGIKDKARSWLGKVTSVSKSSEKFEIHYMVSEPSDETLHTTFYSALKILRKAEVPVHIYLENEAEKLAQTLSEKLHLI